jgi:hypothetical protein
VSEANLYGRIVTPQAVEQAVKATLETWMTDYLGELERIEGYEPNQIARPAGIIVASEFAKWPEDQLPLIMVISTGTVGKPERHERGRHAVAWAVTVAAIVSDVEELESRRLAGAYAGAIRAAILQHKMLRSDLHPDGFAQFLSWQGESYSDLPFQDVRTLDSCRVSFSVGVEDVVTEQAGPREPSGEQPGRTEGEHPNVDPGPLPEVQEVDVTTTPVKVLA